MGLKVLVTGGSAGIGQAAVLKFSKDGHEVFATGRSVEKLSETVQLAEAAGGSKVYKGVGDVGIGTDVERNYAEAIESLGQIDVAVLNAGRGCVAPVEKSSVQDFDDVFNTNVRGIFLWLKAILPAFKKRRSGQIVIINSVAGESVYGPNMTVYTASKFALTGLAQALRLELQGSGIKVASIFPGVVDTDLFAAPFWKKNGIEDARAFFDVENNALSADDIAGAIANIAYQSPRSNIEKLSVSPAPKLEVEKKEESIFGGLSSSTS